jgi:hypothetical protein
LRTHLIATSHPKMGIYDAQQVVSKLDASGSNFWKWDAAVKLYTQIHDATDILTGVKTRSAYPSYEGLIGEPEPLDVTTLDPTNAIDRATMAVCKAFDDNRQSVNDNIERAADRQLVRIRCWGKLDAALKMTFLLRFHARSMKLFRASLPHPSSTNRLHVAIVTKVLMKLVRLEPIFSSSALQTVPLQ